MWPMLNPAMCMVPRHPLPALPMHCAICMTPAPQHLPLRPAVILSDSAPCLPHLTTHPLAPLTQPTPPLPASPSIHNPTCTPRMANGSADPEALLATVSDPMAVPQTGSMLRLALPRARYSPFQKECPIWGPAAGDQLLLRPVICGADVRPRGCREVALVSLARAAWAVAMQSAHARALLPALPWQLM